MPDDTRIQAVTRLLTQAAQTDELARDTHKKLLDWAQRKSNPHQREIAARVCSSVYGKRWPHTALIRLRHILAHDDKATEIAAHALTAYAGSTSEGFQRVIDTVETWLEKHPSHPAGPRAFLTLADPSNPQGTLVKLITTAQTSPKIRDFLITGWWATLEQPEVRERAHQVLLGWAQAVHENRLDRNFTFRILTDVRNAHTPVDAMSRFLYGSPEHEDPALIDARFALANLRACNHALCVQPDCPVKQPPSTSNNGSAAGGSGEIVQ
ncbi:hypothetical protein BGK72_39005 [Streptomyces agglomeratus]|nr:hypothetical protein BGK72_39005 [Streptomyces agglomeratus]